MFDALAQATAVNFEFDKDVSTETPVSLFLRDVTLDEALRVILATQQLDRKLLGDNAILIYPNTPAKQREHQELITRTIPLGNADLKQTQALLRTIAKVRDIHADERLNLLVVRDTPEVMRLVEQLIATVDVPEPEVMLELEVLRLSDDRLENLGLRWPEQLTFGQGGGTAQVPWGQRDQLQVSIVNPAVLADLRGGTGKAALLASQRVRVRNRDKAKLHLGQKLPVFTTTSSHDVSTSVAASVSYLDLGLSLEVEPVIQADNEVAIKLALEASQMIRQVTGPAGTRAYEVGMHQISTSLQIGDGQTQMLAGLIGQEDRATTSGLSGFVGLPLLGRLFGVKAETRDRTQLLLLLTPRIVRNLSVPDVAINWADGGTDRLPGAASIRISPDAAIGSGPVAAQEASTVVHAVPEALPEAPEVTTATVHLSVPSKIPFGGTALAMLKNDSPFTIRGVVEFDATKLQPLQAPPGASSGRLPIVLQPGAELGLLLRALPSAGGQLLMVGAGNMSATAGNRAVEQISAPVRVRLEGRGLLSVEADPTARP
ncbi:MAG TPA: secretin N-terminal domain-containing protein [Roseateles sp.]|uniref:secretin N-terminal domain-containing protein n=1 Tax=Roseateles sp. TaxID=1971397 RepID=UPI002EDB0B7E